MADKVISERIERAIKLVELETGNVASNLHRNRLDVAELRAEALVAEAQFILTNVRLLLKAQKG